jgi:hypothetical protein
MGNTEKLNQVRKMKSLEANYHPDAVKFMLEKHGEGITPDQAKEADQEWAANRSREFDKGHGRVNEQSAEAIMQEPPLGAGVPAKRSEEFDYAKANVGLKSMALSEGNADVPKIFRNNQEREAS